MRSSDRARQGARTPIVLRLVVFCAPIFLAWGLLEFWIAKTVPNSYGLKRQRLEAQAQQVDTLITGSSRAYEGIVPKQLPGFAFNLAGTSQSLDSDYRLMMRVLPKLPKLRRVIVDIEDTSFFYQMHDGFEDWRQYYYQQEWGIPPLESRDWLDVRMVSRVPLRTPLFYREALPGAIRSFVKGTKFVPDPSLLDIDDRGWWSLVNTTAPDLSPEAAAVVLARHASLMKAAYESPNLGYLNRMLSALRRRGIEAVLVTLPVSGNYSSGMNKEYWARTQADTKRIAADYGIRYFCFLTVPELGTQDFTDADHLSRQGAIRFTELLDGALEHSPPAGGSSCACCSR